MLFCWPSIQLRAYMAVAPAATTAISSTMMRRRPIGVSSEFYQLSDHSQAPCGDRDAIGKSVGRWLDRGRGYGIARLGRGVRCVSCAGRREIPAERGHVGVDDALPAPVPETSERQDATGKAGDQCEQRKVLGTRPQAHRSDQLDVAAADQLPG